MTIKKWRYRTCTHMDERFFAFIFRAIIFRNFMCSTCTVRAWYVLFIKKTCAVRFYCVWNCFSSFCNRTQQDLSLLRLGLVSVVMPNTEFHRPMFTLVQASRANVVASVALDTIWKIAESMNLWNFSLISFQGYCRRIVYIRHTVKIYTFNLRNICFRISFRTWIRTWTRNWTEK